MLPYVKDRPLALQSFPDGIEGKGFFIKAVPDYFPEWVQRVTVPKRGGSVTHALANDAATLVYLAGQNAVTPHLWLSRADEPQQPDRLIIDFDPSRRRLRRRACGRAGRGRAPARRRPGPLRDGHRLAWHPRGLPAAPGPGFGEAHTFARALAEQMVEADPRRLTLE